MERVKLCSWVFIECLESSSYMLQYYGYAIYTLPNTLFILVYLVCTLKCKIRYLSEHIYTWKMLW